MGWKRGFREYSVMRPVTFFDPLYCLNRDRYRPGSVVDVELAGIAYSLKIVPPETKLHTAVGEVLMAGAAVLLSASKDDSAQANRTFGDEKAYGVGYIQQPDSFPLPDDYQFCAPVNDVEESEIDAIPVWKFRVTVMRVHDGRQNVDIDIYATREGMPDAAAPVPGDEISGTLWLQGDPTPSVTAPDDRSRYWGFCSCCRAISSKISSTVFLPSTASAMFRWALMLRMGSHNMSRLTSA